MSELQTALTVSLRHIDAPGTSEREREAILTTITEEFSGPTGEMAAQSLHHLREQRRTQMVLKAILDQPSPGLRPTGGST